MTDPTPSPIPSLAWPKAIWNAFWNVSTEYFPRRADGSKAQTIASLQILKEVGEELEDLQQGPDKEKLAALLAHSRETLDEVKALTEYQDQKSTRLLTVVTFFLAVAGLLFNAFSPSHPVHIIIGGDLDPSQVLSAIVYGLFASFMLSAVAGALVIFHANKTRFKYTEIKIHGSGLKPNSYLFFRDIVSTSPADWAGSFKERSNSGSVPAADLSLRYAKNYIAESYLVATKVADKMRYLEPAQAILGGALRILFLWLLLLSIASAFPTSDKAAAQTDSVLDNASSAPSDQN